MNLDATVCWMEEKRPALQWQVHMNSARIQQSHIHVLVGLSQAKAELSKLADSHVESVLHCIGIMQWRWNVLFSAHCVPVFTMWANGKGKALWVTHGIWPKVPQHSKIGFKMLFLAWSSRYINVLSRTWLRSCTVERSSVLYHPQARWVSSVICVDIH